MENGDLGSYLSRSEAMDKFTFDGLLCMSADVRIIFNHDDVFY